VIRRVPRLNPRAPELLAECQSALARASAYAHEHLEDPPDIRDWTWTS
jgi:xylulose-5-phosphate/fructose-6-phosphate phosphoketolase